MIQNNIEFNSVKSIGISFENGPIGFEGISGVDPEFGGVINAVDIDWNGAELGEVNGINLGIINTTGDLMNVLKALANAISVHTKIDPTLKISNPTSTTIADGNTAIIRVTSNVEGTLELTTSSGDGWRATSNSAATPEVSHSIVITNVTTIATAGSIAAGDIIAKFTPTDTTNYNTLTDQSVLKQNITLSAAQPQVTYYWYVGTESINSSNYTSLATQVNTYTSQYEYTSESRSYVYILVHNSKSIQSIIGKATGGNVTYNIDNTINIDNYNVYKTAAITSGSTIIITIS